MTNPNKGTSGTSEIKKIDENAVTQEVLKAEKSYVFDKEKKLL